jgi:hypothetical protein
METVGFLFVSMEMFFESSLAQNILTEPLLSNGLFRVYSLQRERVFGESLASSELPLWLHYSGFQSSCHSIFVSAYRM